MTSPNEHLKIELPIRTTASAWQSRIYGLLTMIADMQTRVAYNSHTDAGVAAGQSAVCHDN